MAVLAAQFFCYGVKRKILFGRRKILGGVQKLLSRLEL